MLLISVHLAIRHLDPMRSTVINDLFVYKRCSFCTFRVMSVADFGAFGYVPPRFDQSAPHHISDEGFAYAMHSVANHTWTKARP